MGLRSAIFSVARKTLRGLSGRGLGNLKPARAAYALFFKYLCPAVEINGCKMFINPQDMVVSKKLVFDNAWEPFETEIFKREIKPGDVVVDLGANIGYYTLLAASLVGPGGKVYAFEPEPDNFALLKKNVEANRFPNVVLEQKAVSNQSGKLKLYVSDQNKGDHQIYASGERRSFVEISAVRLDDYFSGYAGTVDIVKMDIQGAEGLALEGMEKLLARFPKLKLFTEYCPERLRKCGTDPRDYLCRLKTAGFRLQNIDDHKNRMAEVSVEDLLQMPEPETNLLCQRGGDSR